MAPTDGADEAALERSYSVLQPVNVAVAETILKEAKQILDQLGVTFFLRQGTCLGLIRDGGFIPWDDDLDLGSIIGLHGFTEESIDRVVTTFRDNGYFAKVEHNDHYVSVAMMKSFTRTDWTCYRIIDDSIIHYPGVRIPVRLFTQLKEIDFIGEKFLVPNPPEEYLEFKYGAEWVIPKESGYEKDIVEMIPETLLPGQGRRLKQFLSKHILRWRASRLRILDHDGKPVSDAEVVIAGVSRSRTNKMGYAKFNLPCDDWYAVVVKYDNHEEVLYMERMAMGRTYIYRLGAISASGQLSALSLE